MRQRLLRTTPDTWLELGAVALGLVLLSCGPNPPKNADSDASGGDQQADLLAAEAEDTTPLEPAPAPSGVFVRARVKSPGALLAALGDASSSPLDLKRLLTEADDRVRRVLERVVDIDGSAEALVAVHPVSGEEPMAVWSVSARGVRSALQGLDTEGIDTRQGPEGLHYFQLSGESCALGRSLGKAPARIVCADRAESLDSLQAYALRGFPAEPMGDSEVAVRVIAEPLQRQYGKQLRGLRLLAGVGARQLHRDSPRFDSAVSEAMLGLVDELVAIGEDVEGLDFDLWDRQGAFESDLVFRLEGATSWLAGSGRAWKEKQAPAPDLARKIPAEATVMGYLRQMPQKSSERLAKVLGELGAGALEWKGVPRATADRLALSLTLLFSADRTVVHAGGPLAQGGKTPGVAQSWDLVGIDQDRKAVLDILDGFAAALSAKQVDSDPRHRPQLARKTLKLGAGISAIVYEWRLPESLVDALEEGKQQLSKDVPGAGAAGVQQLESGYLAVMASGPSTWIAVAKASDGLTAALTKVDADIPRITSSPEYASFLDQPALGVSFVRLGGLVDQMATVVDPKLLDVSRKALAVAPHRGAFGMVTSFSIKTGTMTEFLVHTRIPDEFLTDSAALLLALSAEQKK